MVVNEESGVNRPKWFRSLDFPGGIRYRGDAPQWRGCVQGESVGISDTNPDPTRAAREAARETPRRVRLLPDALIDQIAAGEVVERPASVVKELVENALDAGARRVRVEIRGGGRDLIAVSDDGCGMSPEDARLALSRHATSKITTEDDLGRIASYGFRGEALPAIASVSRLRLCTRSCDAADAHEIRIEAGRIVSERSVGAALGTRVEVADLFANVPARRKFLKTVATEWGHISEWLARAALSLPEVHFEVRRDDRPATVWPATNDPLDRIAAVVSEEDAAAFVAVDSRKGGREEMPGGREEMPGDGVLLSGDNPEAGAAGPRARLHGFVSRPDRHRSTMAGIYFFVNRRPVRDRLLQHALVDVYRDILPRGRFPAAVLFLDISPEEVDVNVHPAKWEVRFTDPRAIHQLIRHAVRAAIAERTWIGGGAAPADRSAAEPGRGYTQSRPAPHGSSTQAGAGSDWILADGPSAERRAETGDLFADASLRSGEGGGGAQPANTPADIVASVRFGALPLLGQLLATYLAVETKEGLVLIDQHAAHERVLYERLRAEWVEAGVERQGLLLPLTVQLEARSMAALNEAIESVAALGFDLEPLGEGTVAVRAVPALLAERDPSALVRGLAEELAERSAGMSASDPGARVLESADRVFATLACHSARRKGEVLHPKEQQALLDALDAIPWAPTCPHGRPVAVPIGLAEIERRFGRR